MSQKYLGRESNTVRKGITARVVGLVTRTKDQLEGDPRGPTLAVM